MRVNPTTIAAAAVSSLVTLCATIAVTMLAPNVYREQRLSDAQRSEIVRLVKEQIRDNNDAATKALREQGLSDAQRADAIRAVNEHFRNNPEVMQQILAEMIKKRVPTGAPTAAAPPPAPDKSALIKSNAQALFNSPHQVTLGNPQGDVTVVEFFDYNCGFCKRALADTIALLKDDSKLKIVLKELPILGSASVEAAQVSIAARMQDPSGEKYLAFHQKLLSDSAQASKASALSAARDAGLDMSRLETDMASDEVKATLEESTKLARALGINGTPSYVIGESLTVGAVGIAALSDRIKAARK